MDGWKCQWQWVTDMLVHVYGDGADMCVSDDQNQLMWLYEKCLTETGAHSDFRIRVKLIAPDGRHLQFMGYAFRAKQWLGELMAKEQGYHTGGYLASAGGHQLPPMSALSNFVPSLPEFLAKPKPEVLAWKPGTLMAHIVKTFTPIEWQYLCKNGELWFLDPSMIAVTGVTYDAPVGKTQHKLEAKWENGQWTVVTDEPGFKAYGLTAQEMNLLCWGHADPLLHTLKTMVPVEAALLFGPTMQTGHVWQHSDGAAQKVMLESELHHFDMTYIVSGFGYKHKVTHEIAQDMMAGHKYG